MVKVTRKLKKESRSVEGLREKTELQWEMQWWRLQKSKCNGYGLGKRRLGGGSESRTFLASPRILFLSAKKKREKERRKKGKWGGRRGSRW